MWGERRHRHGAVWPFQASAVAQFLPLRRGIPSHDTFSRVFRLIDPQAFETMFREFMAEFVKANGIKLAGVVAIDGKALRGAYERGKSSTPLQMVNVFATEARLALASHKAPGRNEASGALEVLAMFSLEGCIVTADALHCNRPLAATVLERDGHFVLALKKNQAKLFNAVARRFARAGKRSGALRRSRPPTTATESRRATVIRDTSVAAAQRFPGVVALARITSRRRCHGKRAGKPVVRYYLLSKYIPAKRLLTTVRSHWAHRERAALGARRCVRRGRQPSQKGQCPGEPRNLAQACLQHHAHPPRSHLHAPKNQTRRMGRRLPPRSPHPYAIALPTRGGYSGAARHPIQ